MKAVEPFTCFREAEHRWWDDGAGERRVATLFVAIGPCGHSMAMKASPGLAAGDAKAEFARMVVAGCTKCAAGDRP